MNSEMLQLRGAIDLLKSAMRILSYRQAEMSKADRDAWYIINPVVYALQKDLKAMLGTKQRVYPSCRFGGFVSEDCHGLGPYYGPAFTCRQCGNVALDGKLCYKCRGREGNQLSGFSQAFERTGDHHSCVDNPNLPCPACTKYGPSRNPILKHYENVAREADEWRRSQYFKTVPADIYAFNPPREQDVFNAFNPPREQAVFKSAGTVKLVGPHAEADIAYLKEMKISWDGDNR